MSSRRRLRHAPPVARHSRRDVLLAIGVSAAAVVATGLVIWMLRPGGIADRQPRATWLVVLTALALGGYAWWVVHPRSKRRDRPVPWLASGLVLLLVGAVVAGMVWPGGLLRHTERPAPVDLSDLELPDPADVEPDTSEPTTATDTPPTSPPAAEPTGTTAAP